MPNQFFLKVARFVYRVEDIVAYAPASFEVLSATSCRCSLDKRTHIDVCLNEPRGRALEIMTWSDDDALQLLAIMVGIL